MQPSTDAFERARAHFLQGLTHFEAGDWALAEADFRQSLALLPDRPSTLVNLSGTLIRLQQLDEAQACAERALALAPDAFEAHLNLGEIAMARGQAGTALTHFDRALALRPGDGRAHYNRGHAQADLSHWPQALADYSAAIAALPDPAQAHQQRALVHEQLRDLDAAVRDLDAAMALRPDLPFLRGSRLFAQLKGGDWRHLHTERDTLAQELRAGQPGALAFHALALFDRPELQLLAAQLQGRLLQTAPAPPWPPKPPHARIRIGYVSADLREHAVAYLTAGLFEHHDRSQFEIIAIRLKTPDAQDAMAQRLAACFDRILDVQDWRDADIVRAARELGLDIAVDLGGHTAGHRPELFAQRMAPVQVSYIGYLGTMGLPWMDYLLADPVLVDAVNRPHVSECVVTLPCYQVNDTRRPDEVMPWRRRNLGLPDTGFVFACFNNGYKIQPETFERWMRILQAVPDSVLFLYAENPALQTRLTQAARDRGVDPARLVFGEKLLRPQYLARYRLCDLFLDTWPYNAGTTASDALWSGLPVLTCKGQTLPARMAASLLTALDLQELITDNAQAYEALAIDLARSPERMTALREKLHSQRARSPLFDPARFTRHLETAYRLMHQRQHEGLSPTDLVIPTDT